MVGDAKPSGNIKKAVGCAMLTEMKTINELFLVRTAHPTVLSKSGVSRQINTVAWALPDSTLLLGGGIHLRNL